MLALFDADILVFRCGMAAERRHWFLKVKDETYDFEYKKEAMAKLDDLLPGQYSREEGKDYQIWNEINLEPLSHALQNVKTLVQRCLDAVQLNAFDVHMYLSPGGQTFRHNVAKTKPYKGNRDRTHRPTYEKEIREFIQGQWPTYVADNEEADDLLGIAQTEYTDSVIITLDKDLDQIPGPKYNYMHDVAYTITPQQARMNFAMQLLMGDTTDNIPGLPGIGKGKANKALHGLSSEEELMDECVRMYITHSPDMDKWQEYMTEMGQLVWIRRTPGQMWTPPEEPEDDWTTKEISLYDD